MNRIIDYDVKITIDQWLELLSGDSVFLDRDFELIRRIYISENHAKTCYEMGREDGKSASSYISVVTSLAKRISKNLELPPVIKYNGEIGWWPVLFNGKFRNDGRFEWIIKENLSEAIQKKYPEWNYIENDKDADLDFIEDLRMLAIKKINNPITLKGIPKKKENPVIVNGRLIYPRDRKTALNALAITGYTCEINKDHPTFIRKNSDQNYTEPHHLIPLAYSGKFDVSLDVEENIISLCSNCHNHIHYGKEAEWILKELYFKRKKSLQKVGIEVSYENLLKMY